jgi:Ser/Thr protein kinase RdoA (MazF antagonist)
MPKINPDLQIKPTASILNKILSQYDLRLVSFKIFKDGVENTSMLVSTNLGKFVLRIYRKNRKKVKIVDQELRLMDFLRQKGIPIPQILPNVHSRHITIFPYKNHRWNCIVMEFSPGAHPRKYSTSFIKEMAITQAKMHVLGKQFAKKEKNKNPVWKFLKEGYFASKIKTETIKNPKVRDIIERTKNFEIKLPDTLPQGFNHLDITHDNILVKNHHLSAILDFDDACYSPIVVCLGYVLWDVLYITRKTSNLLTYLSAYQRHRKLTKKEIAILNSVLHFRNYVIGAMEIQFWGEHGKHVETFLKFEKIIEKLSFEEN